MNQSKELPSTANHSKSKYNSRAHTQSSNTSLSIAQNYIRSVQQRKDQIRAGVNVSLQSTPMSLNQIKIDTLKDAKSKQILQSNEGTPKALTEKQQQSEIQNTDAISNTQFSYQLSNRSYGSQSKYSSPNTGMKSAIQTFMKSSLNTFHQKIQKPRSSVTNNTTQNTKSFHQKYRAKHDLESKLKLIKKTDTSNTSLSRILSPFKQKLSQQQFIKSFEQQEREQYFFQQNQSNKQIKTIDIFYWEFKELNIDKITSSTIIKLALDKLSQPYMHKQYVMMSPVKVDISATPRMNQTKEEQYQSLKSNINEFLQQKQLPLLSNDNDITFDKPKVIGYEDFKKLLQHLQLIEYGTNDPRQDYTLGQIWLQELNSSYQCDLHNILTFIAGILNINTNQVLTKKEEIQQFEQKESCMAFKQNGFGKFLNQDKLNECYKKYEYMSKLRESKLPPPVSQETQNKDSQQDLRVIEFDALQSLNEDKQSALSLNYASPNKGYQTMANGNSPKNKSRRASINSREKSFRKIEINLVDYVSERQQKILDEQIKIQMIQPKENLVMPIIQIDQWGAGSSRSQKKEQNYQDITQLLEELKNENYPKIDLSNILEDNDALQEGVINPKKHNERKQRLGNTKKSVQVSKSHVQKLDMSRTSKHADRKLAVPESKQHMLRKQHTGGRARDNSPLYMNDGFEVESNKISNPNEGSSQKNLSTKDNHLIELKHPDHFLREVSMITNSMFGDLNTKTQNDFIEDNSFQKQNSMCSKQLSEIINKKLLNEETNVLKNRPLFFLDVKIPPDMSPQKIIFYERDSPKQLATRFIELHKLNDKMIPILEKQLRSKMDDAFQLKRESMNPNNFKYVQTGDPFAKKYSEDLQIVNKFKGFKVLGNAEKRPLPKIRNVSDDEW
ncbi:UNKNOWN [Stylonychia lemnae]|uniref:Uncharacterized protein n=1 Tax=Stylonychia lemnae TaxID=5949 RepID=A0A078AAS2_STYLE|nr:UNKNOWN [Stylonychia lemnae]|eukprot:CDW77873.1 UNKNOWN [Stylonychia lemnae]